MTFDFNAQEQQILARLADAAAAAGIPVETDSAVIDLTDTAALPVGAQIVFLDLVPIDQTGRSALHYALWAFDAYIDPARALSAHKAALSALFSAAMSQIVGWEIAPGRVVRAERVQRSGSDGRARRRSFGFSLPVYLAG